LIPVEIDGNTYQVWVRNDFPQSIF
jgi:hypothetical protein